MKKALVCYLVMGAFGAFNTTHSFAGPVNEDANSSSNLNLAQAATSATDVGRSGTDCVCISKKPPTPCQPSFAQCAAMGQNLGSVASALKSMMANKGTKDKASDYGSTGWSPFGDWSAYPDNPLKDWVATGGLPQDIKDSATRAKELLSAGVATPPQGMTVEDAIDSINRGLLDAESALADASKFLDNAGNGSPNLNASNDTSDLSGTGGATAGQTLTPDQDALSGSVLRKGKTNTIGHTNATGLGNVQLNNLLDMSDSETGRSLTIWERATRRYYGKNNDRLLFLARLEFIRQEAAQKLKKSSAPPLAVATPSEKKTPPAKMQPASWRN